MKKFKSLSIVATVVVLLIAAILGYYIYTTTDAYQVQKLYNELGNDYTASQCDSITKRFPNSEYAEKAQEKKRNLLRQQSEWETIKNKPTLQAIQNFKKKHQLTSKLTIAVEQKLDSLLWVAAINSKLKKSYEEYGALGQMAEHYNEAMYILQGMHKLPEVETVTTTLQEQATKFFAALGEGNADDVAALCADTVSFFLFHQNLSNDKVKDFVNNVYCKNIKKRTFEITSNLEFDKARIGDEAAGYAVQFNIAIISPKKVARKHKVILLFTPECKIVYAALRPVR